MKPRTLFVLALAMLIAAPAFAETQNVKVSGSIDAYAFYRHNYDLAKSNDIGGDPAGGAFPVSGTALHRSDSDEFLMSQVQLEIAADLTDNVSTVINLANERDWNADVFGTAGAGTTPDNTGAEFDILLDLAYVQMKEIFYAPLTLTVGRQDVWFGRGFIIGNNIAVWDPGATIEANEYSVHTAFDAIRATLDFNPWTIDMLYSKINENAHDPEDDLDLYAVNVNYKFAEYNAVAEGYFVAEKDEAALSGASGTKNNSTYVLGGRVQFDPISQITLGAEVAYQFGDYAGALTSPERDRSAWGLDLFGTYRWDNTWKPEATLEYVHMSGENDISTGTKGDYHAWNTLYRGKFWTAYGDFRESVYQTADTGDQAATTNRQFVQIAGSINPMDDLKLTAALTSEWLDEAIHSTPTDVTTNTRADSIGWEFDLQAVYDYTEDVSFGLLAAFFDPGDFYGTGQDATATDLVSSLKVAF